MLFFPLQPNQQGSECVPVQEAAAETKCLSCLDQQGWEEKETQKNPFNLPRP